MAQRKGYVYRQYIHSSSNGVNIPDSTWRRWLREGRVTKEQLIEIGIQPVRRRRQRRQVAHPNREALAIEPQPTPQSNDDADAIIEETPSEENRCATVQTNASVNGENCEEPGNNSLQAAETSYWSLFTSGSEDEDHGEEVNQAVIMEEEEGEILSSVLESSNIGVDKLNEPLVPFLEKSKFETLLMILHLAMRHGYTDVFLEDLMSFVNELVGVKDAIPQTKFLFNKLFMFTSQSLTHFFCPTCNIYLGKSNNFKDTVVCIKCKVSKTASSLNGGNYFLSLSIKNQIKDVLSRPHIQLVSRDQRVTNNISDIVDGLLYQSLMKDGDELIRPNTLTITFNSDGSPIFKSGPNSLWPIQFIINEIIPEQRFAAENVLLAGLWFSKSKPSMEVFLKPFVDDLKDLEINGVVWKKSDGSLCESPILAICCCVDSVAKPQLQKLTQFNGYYGCGYCLHKNNRIRVVEEVDRRSGLYVANNDADCDDSRVTHCYKNLLRYTVGEQFPLRTDRQLRQHMKLAENTGQVTYGAKGVSMLCSLKYFNIVHGFSVDYMHAILLGVTKRLANLWFDSTSSGEEYYMGPVVDQVNKRLADISPPSNMREVRPISDRVHWKANEWRGFLLYFGLPALINILPHQFFTHFQKLVTAIYTLSKDSITYDEIEDANRLLQEFVRDFQNLYGEVNMVYNVHLCSHIARAVSKVGPLWANSAFPFESGNGRLVKLAKGTRGVVTQIARKYLMMFSVPKLMRWKYKARDSTIDFCSNIIGYKYLKNSTTCNGVELLGIESHQKLTDEQCEAFRNRNILTIPKYVPAFNRAVKCGTIYTGRLTSRQIKHNDTCVRLTTGNFAEIQLIMKLSVGGVEKVWCFCREINIAFNPSSNFSPHIKQCSLQSFGSLQLIPFDNVEKKCLLISCGEKKYVSEFPNTYEKD